MTTYDTMRHFADSWMLLALFAIFVGVVLFVFRPGSRRKYQDLARLPLDDEKKA
jgi:cytochrome c oxidase cbb3-type subunit 4